MVFKSSFCLLLFLFLAGLGLCCCTPAFSSCGGGASLRCFPTVKSLTPYPFCVLLNNLEFFCKRDLSLYPQRLDLRSQSCTYIIHTHGVYFILWIIAQFHFISLVSVSASTFRNFFSLHGAHHRGDVSTSYFGGVARCSRLTICIPSPPQAGESAISPRSLFLFLETGFQKLRQASNEGNF